MAYSGIARGERVPIVGDGGHPLRDSFQSVLLSAANFLKNPLRNAALLPSSKSASAAIVAGLDFSSIDEVVELGPGTGVVTAEILKRCRSTTRLMLIEIEKSYVPVLRKRFRDRVIVDSGSAHRLDAILAMHGMEKPDLIVSALPFLPKEDRAEFIESIKRQTAEGAIFRMFTRVPPLMRRIYRDLPMRKIALVPRNLPPMWVYGIN
jgi:phospholipid N-methyltransferase